MTHPDAHRMPVESLRPGGLPADAFRKPAPTAAELEEALRDYASDVRSTRGQYPDGTPRVAAVDSGGLVHLPHIRQVEQCSRCESQFISKQFLAAHIKADHGNAGDGPG